MAKPKPKPHSTLKAPTPTNKAVNPGSGGASQIQAVPDTAPPNVSNYANFSDEGAAVGAVQPAATDDSTGVPLAGADGIQQYVYTSSAPLIAAGNPKE